MPRKFKQMEGRQDLGLWSLLRCETRPSLAAGHDVVEDMTEGSSVKMEDCLTYEKGNNRTSAQHHSSRLSQSSKTVTSISFFWNITKVPSSTHHRQVRQVCTVLIFTTRLKIPDRWHLHIHVRHRVIIRPLLDLFKVPAHMM